MGRRDVILSGNLADAETSSPNIKVLDYQTKIIFVKCTHGSNNMQFRVLGYFDGRDTTNSVRTILGWTFLDFGDSILLKTTDPYDEIEVEAKNASAGNNSSTKIWLNSGGFLRA